MEHLLRFALLALLSRPNSSLEDIVPIFTNKAFRRKVLQSVTDPQVLKFWNDEYPKMNYMSAFDGVAPIANKLGAFLANPVVRKTLCDPEKPLRFRTLMDEGTPLVVNLSKGRLGTDVSNVVGGLVLSMIAQAAYTREDVPYHRRSPFFTYVDEFHAFTTDSLCGMLSELRKYKCGLVLIGQHTTQFPRSVLDSILENVGSFCVFRLGAQDAPLISRQLGDVHPKDIINLPNFRMFTKLMVEGVQTKSFSGKTHKA